jgi:hypothetical protein
MGQLVADDIQQLLKKHNASKGRAMQHRQSQKYWLTLNITEVHQNRSVITTVDTGTP